MNGPCRPAALTHYGHALATGLRQLPPGSNLARVAVLHHSTNCSTALLPAEPQRFLACLMVQHSCTQREQQYSSPALLLAAAVHLLPHSHNA